MDISTDIHVDVRAELSVLRTVWTVGGARQETFQSTWVNLTVADKCNAVFFAKVLSDRNLRSREFIYEVYLLPAQL